MASFPTSATTTVNLNTCQKVCVKVGLLQSCGPANVTQVLWTVPSGSTTLILINPETGSSPMSAIITGVNPGSVTIEVLIKLNGGATPSYGIFIPVTVVQDPTLTPTFSFGTPVLKTQSFPTPCGSNLLTGPSIQPIQPFQPFQSPSQFLQPFQTLQGFNQFLQQ